MSKKSYHLKLKGYVGGWNFSSYDVDHCLANNKDSEVNILIDSTGGSLATGLSIQAALANHGNVCVHFVGLNASAATIASLGAKHISIDAGAMYLVHKCSTSFFEWSSLNADQFRTLIDDCKKTVADLDKLDLNVARMYARKCKKPVEDLLALMKVGGWLSPQEALEWGFVDEVTDFEDDAPAKLTEEVATAFACEGIPMPPIPVDAASPFAKFIAAVSSLFSSFIPKQSPNPNSNYMEKSYDALCSAIDVPSIALKDNMASLSEKQLQAADQAIAKANKDLQTEQAKVKDLEAKTKDLEAKVKDLEEKMQNEPADESKKVVGSKADDAPGDDDPVTGYVDSYNEARKLFDALSL